MLKGLFKKRKAETIVLGIHGLGNKPAHGLLKSWWKKSLIEGLRKIEGAPTQFNFRMVYWADIMYEYPLSPKVRDPKHELHIEEPYLPEPISSIKKRSFFNRLKTGVERLKETIFLSKHGLAHFRGPFDYVVKRTFRELAEYYQLGQTDEDKLNQEPVKRKIRERLRRFLYKHRKKKILIVAHSMGSIVAYDVLLRLQNIYEIDVFISMGSPLGLPMLRESSAFEHKLDYQEGTMLPTPNSINKWYNIADKDDPLTVFHSFSDYFSPNEKGVIPTDLLVNNDYKDWITNNAHKSFGYLRCKEMGHIMTDFLTQERESFWQRSKKFFGVKNRKK